MDLSDGHRRNSIRKKTMKDIDDVFDKATGGNETVPDDWMAATNMRPLLQDDPGLLWLKYHGEDAGLETDTKAYAFTPWISLKGQEFERVWLLKEAPDAVKAMEHDWDVRQVTSFRTTLELIQKKTPCIAKAALWWAKEGIFGSSDLICLASWFYRKFPHLRPADWKATCDYYVVVDMKFTSGLHTPKRRDDLEKYACQMRIYSYALGQIQGYMPKRAYIISRDRIHDPIPVEINQELSKPLDKTLRDYREQYRRIKLRGKRLKPWKDSEVAPNYSNPEDYPYHKAKEIIQTELVKGQSLTMLPGIGNKLADSLEDLGFECLADLLAKKSEDIPLEEVDGIGPVMAARIRAVLKANRSKKATKVPLHIVPEKARTELYVDMEYFSNVNCDMEAEWPLLEGCPMVFMIGVGWLERGRWKYQQFVAEAESHKAERKMFRQFLAFLESKGVFDKSDEKHTVALYHWSDAEPNQVRQAIERHGSALKRLEKLPWVDLLTTVFYAAPIAIPGQWKFGLKEMSAALSAYSKKHATSWPEGLSSGQAAQIAGWEAYRQAIPLATTKEHDLLTAYLEADVKALSNVLSWLRESAEEEAQRRAQASGGSWYAWARGERTVDRAPDTSHGWYRATLESCSAGAVIEDNDMKS
jgi:uncharacterized protein